MNILLLGSGAREHAFAWKIAQSSDCDKLYIAPGNGGTAECGENIQLDITDFDAIGNFVLDKKIHILVVGPEGPLVNGIYDYFKNDLELKYIPVIGPSKAGAQLEGSKDFAKQFMGRHKIPTAQYNSFIAETLNEGLAYIDSLKSPYVIKADGLASGKGVVICNSPQEAKDELKAMLSGKFGEASTKVVIEEFLKGIEFSIFILTDGISYKILPSAKDYKRVGEGDTGLNTGGMGAISPVPFLDEKLLKKVEEKIIIPTIDGLREEQIVYKGFLYFGLMNVQGEPYVIEYNARMGDPETQAVLPRIKSDLLDLFEGVVKGNLASKELLVADESAATIVLASGGYPGNYEKGKVINGLSSVNGGSFIFHAGTTTVNSHLETNGGRVMAITAYGNSLKEAVDTAKKAAENISFDGKYYRKDIGWDVLN